MKILLTGANGYIGARLIPLFLEKGHTVICCVRNKSRLASGDINIDHLQVLEADFLDQQSLEKLPKDIDVAFYLIHSMASKTGDFMEQEQLMAQNFVDYLEGTSARQLIYLSGIANEHTTSEHFQSRLATEEILKSSKVAYTVFRAAIIVGSGSASFEIIRDLVEKLPVMVAPRWLNSRCQPIGVRDVLHYLTESIGLKASYNRVFDIAGPEVLSYKDMLLQFARVRRLRRYILTLPLLTPRLSSLWLYLVTSTSVHLARNLVDSMKFDVLAGDDSINEIIPRKCMSYEEAVQLAFLKISQNAVLSSWKDAAASSGTTLIDPEEYSEVPRHGCFKDLQMVQIGNEAEVDQVLENVWSLGGSRGYYYATYLWKLRGYLDKFVGGIGLRRGRRSPTELNPGDALDFWRVLVSNKEERKLLLYAEMKLPGEAWLEFRIVKKGGKPCLLQTATFRPRGLFGRMYWYAVWPFHIFVFGGMAKNIVNYRPSDAREKRLSEAKSSV